jgi:hypothetical protein
MTGIPPLRADHVHLSVRDDISETRLLPGDRVTGSSIGSRCRACKAMP